MEPPTTKTKLIWGSSDLIIVNPTPHVEKHLHYNHRSLEFDFRTRQRRSKVERVLLYTVLCEAPRIIKTFQGYIDEVLELLKNSNTPYDFDDRRIKIPEPNFAKIHGFRLKQEELFRAFHSHGRSGIVQAPCRYGKSKLITNTLRVFPGLKTVVAAPGVDLLNQTVEDLKRALPHREVVGIFSGAKGKRIQSDDITVTSLDSLSKIDKEGTQLVLVDEPHAAVSESRAPELAAFRNARIYGFGATISGRYDGADKLISGIIGPTLAKRTFKEAVVEGAICPITVYAVKLSFEPMACRNRDDAYAQLIYRSDTFNDLVKTIADQHIPADFQTIIFADEIKQIDLISRFVDSGTPAYAKDMKMAERRRLFDDMVKDKIKRTVASDIFSTGVTFPELRVLINATAGGANISSVQRAGRLAEIRPGKKCGYLIDFEWMPEGYSDPDVVAELNKSECPWLWVVKDSMDRLQAYQNLGYDVKHVESLDEIIIE